MTPVLTGGGFTSGRSVMSSVSILRNNSCGEWHTGGILLHVDWLGSVELCNVFGRGEKSCCFDVLTLGIKYCKDDILSTNHSHRGQIPWEACFEWWSTASESEWSLTGWVGAKKSPGLLSSR